MLALCLVLFFGISNLQYGFEPLFDFYFIGIPLFIAFIIYVAVKGYVLQVNHKKPLIKSVWLQRLVYCLLISFTWFLTVVIGWASYDMLTDKPPQFFPFDDSKATYSIEYENNMYWIHYKSTSDSNTYSYCEWDNDGTEKCGKRTDRDMIAFIASSPVELKQFLNKQVIVDGEFVYTTKQCERKTCREYGSGFAGLAIDEIKLK